MASKVHLGNPKTGRPTCGKRASYGTHNLSDVTCQRCYKIARVQMAKSVDVRVNSAV